MSLYKAAEDVLSKLDQHKGTIKNLVFSKNYKNPKQLYALVCEALKYKDVLVEIIDKVRLKKKHTSHHLTIILLYELLFGKGLQCSANLKQIILPHKTQIHAALARIKIKRKVSNNKDLAKKGNNDDSTFCKYLRVNTLVTDINSVTKSLTRDGFNLLKNCTDLELNQFFIDQHIPNLLVFNINQDFHDHELYTSGRLIFQDKSSCFSAAALNPPENCEVIDACAAPGNKTSHLAAIMRNTGKIFAFDIDPNRISTMKTLLERAQVKNCKITRRNFLKVDPTDPRYRNVNFILLDPSCSGSGIVNRLSHLTDSSESQSTERLKSLSEFQLSILNHALSFPNLKKLIYSTCSVHKIENEEVVEKALKQNQKFRLFKCLPQWPRREEKENKNCKKFNFCVRSDPKFDCTNGFFVAGFKKM